jgi:hypothetical protein
VRASVRACTDRLTSVADRYNNAVLGSQCLEGQTRVHQLTIQEEERIRREGEQQYQAHLMYQAQKQYEKNLQVMQVQAEAERKAREMAAERARREAEAEAEQARRHAEEAAQREEKRRLLAEKQEAERNWDMGSRNGMGMPSMQHMQNMQHRYPGDGHALHAEHAEHAAQVPRGGGDREGEVASGRVGEMQGLCPSRRCRRTPAGPPVSRADTGEAGRNSTCIRPQHRRGKGKLPYSGEQEGEWRCRWIWAEQPRTKINGPSKRNVEINKQITVCQDSRDLCSLIDARIFKKPQQRGIICRISAFVPLIFFIRI